MKAIEATFSALWFAVACAPADPHASANVESPAPTVTVEAPAERCPGESDVRLMDRCTAFWGTLHAGDVKKIPLAERCRLATILADAAVDTVSRMRTRWQRFSREKIDLVVIVGPEPRPRWILIAEDESCPTHRIDIPGVRSDQPPSFDITVRGSVSTSTFPDLAVHLDERTEGTCSCAATFSWWVGDGVQALHPPSERRPRLHSLRFSDGLRRPRLVLEVAMDDSFEFVITRRALELN